MLEWRVSGCGASSLFLQATSEKGLFKYWRDQPLLYIYIYIFLRRPHMTTGVCRFVFVSTNNWNIKRSTPLSARNPSLSIRISSPFKHSPRGLFEWRTHTHIYPTPSHNPHRARKRAPLFLFAFGGFIYF